MKVAIATTSKYEAVKFRKVLVKNYRVTIFEENKKDGLFTSIFTVEESNWASMLKMFNLIAAVTGVNPYTRRRGYGKNKEAKTIAAVILRKSYGLKTPQIAEILGYKDHSSVSENTKGIEIKNIKRLPLELVIRRIRQQI